VANTSARALSRSTDIKDELLTQLTTTVQWQRSMEHMIDLGTATFIEIGAGKVLTGLIKRINRTVKTFNVGEVGELKNILG
jgi:[acyl-carrier-protein] S-malonyltransferase